MSKDKIARRDLLAALGSVAAATLAPAAVAPQARAAEPAVKGDGGKIRWLANAAGTSAFPPYVMQKFKLDQKYGFELQVIPVANVQAQVTAFQAGAAEFGGLGWNDIARMRTAGVNVVGVAPWLIWADSVLVPKDSPAKNLGDLKGKKVGTINRTTLNWLIMRAVTITNYKFDIEKDSVVQEGAISLLRGLTEQGQLDATMMFNSLAPDMLASGKYRMLASIRDLVKELGLPDTPFLLHTADAGYAAKNPANTKAFLAALREAIQILNTDDAVWVEKGRDLKINDKTALEIFRDEARADMMTAFLPTTEADIRKTFDALLAVGGVSVMGMSTLPDGFMTLAYQ
jgi:NitT/TauT family transport system substrate-binding protein